MSVAELKNDIHRLVVNTEDESILINIRTYFGELATQTDWWDNLSEKQHQSIFTGNDQLDSGHVVLNSEVRRKVNALLNK
jgi:hypothetical protein